MTHKNLALMLIVCATLVAPSSSRANGQVPYVHQVLIDTDNEPSTGCSFPVHEKDFTGNVEGIEQLLVVLVAAQTTEGTVQSIERRICDPNTDSFGAGVPVDGGDWPVGTDNGDGGADTIEAYVARADLGAPGLIRLAFYSE